jgi:hypothetical protein
MPTDPYNQNATPRQNIDDSKEVGPNCVLEVPGIGEVPVTNVSFSEEAETSEVQYTTGFNKDIAVTGVTYSGSFEISGNANKVRGEGWTEANSSGTNLPKHVDNLVIRDENSVYTFKDVLLNSHSKDIPSDDRTTQSFDFMAQRAFQN